MNSKLPIIKQVAWLSVIPHIILLLCIQYLAQLIGLDNYVPAGLMVYFALFYILRFKIPKHHRKGAVLFKKNAFSAATPEFQKSYDFFKNNSWIDRFRFITLMSSSRVSYTEMALLNMAFCYSQIGMGKESKEIYEKALKDFPDSEIVKAALRMYESAESIAEHVSQSSG